MPAGGSRWSLGGGQGGWTPPSYSQIQRDRTRRELKERDGATIARLNHDTRQLQQVRRVARQASNAAVRSEVVERNAMLLAPRAVPGLTRSRSMGNLRYGVGGGLAGGGAGALRREAELLREKERLELQRIELQREANRQRERRELANIDAQRRAVQADTARVRRLSATGRLGAPIVPIGPVHIQPQSYAVPHSPTSLVPAGALIPPVGAPGLRRTASFNSGLIRPGMRHSLAAPVALPVAPVHHMHSSPLLGGRPRVNSMSGLSPRLRPVQATAPVVARPPVVNYNTYNIQPEHHDFLGLPAQVSHLNLSPRAVPLHSFGGGHGGGWDQPHDHGQNYGGVQRVRHASFGSFNGGGGLSPASFGSPQQFHSAQHSPQQQFHSARNSPQMGYHGGDFDMGGAYLGPPGGGGGLMMPGGGAGYGGAAGAGGAYAQPAPQEEFVFTDEPSYPGRQVVQNLGEAQGYSNSATAGEDPLDAAIKSLVSNAQMMGANGVLSMDVNEDAGGNVIVRGLAVVLA